MTAKPKVSVIVPIYKVEKYLRECVDSLLCQTLQEIQIILVDDGSPDSCPEICEEYARRDARVQVIHKENGGLLRARITGVEAAAARYIGFVDGDDFAAPELFETMLQAAVEQDAELVCTSFWKYQNEGCQEKYAWRFPSGFFSGERMEAEFYPQWFEDHREGKQGLIKAVWCKLFDRLLLEKVYTLVPQQVTIGEDLITTYSAAALAERIIALPDTALYYYRCVQGSMTNSYWPHAFENQTAVLTFLEQMPCREGASAFIKNGAARLRAYALYDILHNECKLNRTSNKEERARLIAALLNEDAWREAAKRDVLPKDNETARLFQNLLLHRRPRLLQTAIDLAVFKNRLTQGKPS